MHVCMHVCMYDTAEVLLSAPVAVAHIIMISES